MSRRRPVFVDASGRRQRRVRRLGRLLVVPAVAYVGLLVSTLLGGPTLSSPYLPLPDAPHAAHQPSTADGHGADDRNGAVAGASPTTGHTGSATAPAAGASTTTGPSTGGTPSASISPSATVRGKSAGHASATPTHGGTHTAAPPGSTKRATPTKKA